MPTWKGSLPEEMLWAMAYYVESLIEIKDTAQPILMKEELRSQAGFTPPDEG